MSGVTWLHLSDWHQGGPTSEGNYNRQVVRDKLLEDITHRAAINNDLAHIDFIVFSGDVAHAGAMDQYEAAKLFFDQLLAAAGLTGRRDRLFIVPGNHDLDDSVLETIEEDDLRRPLEANNINDINIWIDAYLSPSSDPTRHDRLMLPFKHYSRFIETYNKQSSPTYASLAQPSLEGASAALVGLNSALMCRRKEENARQEDFGKLLVGEPQVRKQLAALRGVDIKIAVMHHPLSWLCWPDQRRIKPILIDNFDFLLYGHTHIYGAFNIVERWGRCFVVGAGCTYQSREYFNSYNYFHFDGTINKGTIWVRRWDDWVGEWIKGPFKTNGKILYGGFYHFPQPEKMSVPAPILASEPPIDTHYSELVDAILKGTVVPVLGADLNLCDHSDDKPWGWKLTSPHAPSNLEVTAFLEQELQGGMPVSIDCPFSQGQGDVIPLACPLHAKRDVTWLDLPRISQDFWVREQSLSAHQTTIIEAIRKINHTQFDCNAIYGFLTSKLLMQSYGTRHDDTEIVAGTRYPLIVTTCFDSTLEHAFLESGQPFKLVAFDAASNRFLCRISVKNKEGTWELSEPKTWDRTGLQLDKMPLVLRMFGPTGKEGSTDKAPFAITEDHFLDYLIKTSNFQIYPKPLATKLRSSRLWFLGYNLSYWHLRMFIRQIESDRNLRAHWWAVQAHFSRLERELWGLDKKTNLFSDLSFVHLEKYIADLRQRLECKAQHN